MPEKNPFLKKSSHLLIYGAGGQGRVVADAAAAAGAKVLGFADDLVAVGTRVLGFPVLGDGRWLSRQKGALVALGVGDNAGRARIAAQIEEWKLTLATVAHPSAVISPFAHIGLGTVLLALSVVNPGAQVGKGAIINTGAVVEHDTVVGDFAHVCPNAVMAGTARVGRLSQLGAGGTVLPGISVGDRSMVGAGAVVHRDVPDGCVAAGVPARVIRRLDSASVRAS